MTRFATLEEMVAASFEAMRPTEFLSVTEAAERYHIIRQPGSHNGPWSRDRTPYIVEVQDLATSLEFEAVVLAAPARTGKSIALTNWLAHTAKIDPADMMVVHMAQHTAREWVKSDLERSLRNSPAVGSLLSPAKVDDNLFDKQFLSGMRLTVTWPTVKNLSGKTIPRKWLMDYDRMPDNVDGEGDPFTLAHKRGATFGRFNMTVAEGSPGRDVTTPRWLPRTPHEAPPTTGILALYNLGDRRRWYWPCPHCETAFEPDFPLLHWNKAAPNLMAMAESVYMACPHCGGVIEPGQKDEINRLGRWVADGLVWLPSADQIIEREGMSATRSNIASFWLKGPAAGFQTWQSLVLEYLQAMKVFEETGDETKLRATTNTGQGLPYTPRALLSERLPEALREKAEDWGSAEDDPTVPDGVRFLVATIDVQARAFVVQVHGFAPNGDIFIIDGFKVRISNRLDSAGRTLPVDPSSFAEDWELLVEQVMQRTYRLGDDSGRRMAIKMTACDSGGREGVTYRAYDFWRGLKARGDGLHRSFALLKGAPSKASARAYVAWPDSSQTGLKAIARGDVPVIMLNSNLLKDQAAGMLGRRTGEDQSGGGMVRYPDWFQNWFYEQMTNEVRNNDKGEWGNTAKRRNEAWDLLYYALGIASRSREMNKPVPFPTIDVMRPGFWAKPPEWATAWDTNELVVWPEVEQAAAPALSKVEAADPAARFRDFGAALA